MGGFVSELHAQPASFSGDGQSPVAELAHQVEGLSRRLLAREPQRVLRDVLLHRLAHHRSRAEEAVRRHESSERLVRPLEVVAVDEDGEPSLTVFEVGEDGAREKLLPERLPEALNLPERLRMLRAAGDVADAVLTQRLLKPRLSAPRLVLPALVRQHFLRRAPVGNSALEGFQHQRGLLVVREDVRDEKA